MTDPNNIPANEWCVVVILDPDHVHKTFCKTQEVGVWEFNEACEEHINSFYDADEEPDALVVLYGWFNDRWNRVEFSSGTRLV